MSLINLENLTETSTYKTNNVNGFEIAVTLDQRYFNETDLERASSAFVSQAGNMLTDFIQSKEVQPQNHLDLYFPEFYLPVECRRMIVKTLKYLHKNHGLKSVHIITNDIFIIQACEGLQMQILRDKKTEMFNTNLAFRLL